MTCSEPLEKAMMVSGAKQSTVTVRRLVRVSDKLSLAIKTRKISSCYVARRDQPVGTRFWPLNQACFMGAIADIRF